MGFLGNVIAIFVGALVFALARKYMPAPPARELSEEERDAAITVSPWFPWLAMVAFGILFALTSYFALFKLNRYVASSDGSPQFILLPQSAIWWFLPLFGALVLPWDVTLELWALAGHRLEARLYREEASRKVDYDPNKMMHLLAILAAPIALASILALSMHVSLGEAEIHDCGYAFASCKVYLYSAARRMTIINGYRARDGKLDPQAGIVIDFADGRRWSSAETGGFRKTVDPALQNFLAKKIQLPFQHAETAADIPPISPSAR